MRTLAFAAVTRSLPTLLQRRFDQTSAGDLDATFELRVRGPREARFGVRIRHGRCEITEPAAVDRAPGAVVEIAARDLIELAAGRVAWPQLLSARRLAFTGDPFLALRFPTLFRLV